MSSEFRVHRSEYLKTDVGSAASMNSELRTLNCLRLALDEALEFLASRGMSELPQRLGLDLSDPFPGDVELLAHFL